MLLKTEKKKPLFQIRLARKQALKITIIYLLVGTLWIIFSDMLTEQLIPERYNIVIVSIVKGVLYVLSTAVLLYGLIYSALKKLTDSEEKLNKSETLLRTVFNQAPIGIAISQTDTKTMNVEDNILHSINPMFERITGRTKDELRKISWGIITHPEDFKKEIALAEQLDRGEITSYSIEKRYLRPDGSVSWASKTAVPLNVENDAKKYSLFLIQDINESKAVAGALAESERSKSVLLANLQGMAYRCKFDNLLTTQFVSEGCFGLNGYSKEHFLQNNGISYAQIIGSEYMADIRRKLEVMVLKRLPYKFEYEIITANNQRKWVLDIGRGVYDEMGNVDAIEGIVIDITERKQHEIRLKFLSERDVLTGLYNRRFFEEFLAQEALSTDKTKRAVVLLDLKKMNSFNMVYGYGYSEDLIKEITMQLSSLCNDDRHIFQISFERIAFYIKNYDEQSKLSVFCEDILCLLDKMQIKQSLECNIGVLEIDKCHCSASDILKNVSIAAAKSAENPDFAYSYFEENLETKLAREALIKEELIAVARGDDSESIFLLYQPIFEAKSGGIHAFEALARFESKNFGVVSPLEFISLAEETQMIIPIGRKILHKACHFLKELKTLGYSEVVVSVNVSAIQMLRSDFVSDVKKIIEETAINPKLLALEVTESIFLASYDSINKDIGKLREMGIKFSIDDFGVGYSSLARERELQVDGIKLDKYFADDLLVHNQEEAIAGDIISMMHKLGHTVVAEGVEEESQKEYLVAHNCDYLQGYLFSKPVSPEIALELLKVANRL
ncbi:MAG: phosphodiesterase [Negativicutes bacterium]|nr:phosphodiesterase [Negativicutes bacterium]